MTRADKKYRGTIYVLEGADGTGKSTLANIINRETKAAIIHCTFDKTWDIKDHHTSMICAAELISQWTDVVLDRWALSELIYGTVFRGKPGYDIEKLIHHFETILPNIVWVYCRNDFVERNHQQNKQVREEMYDSMSKVIHGFDRYVLNDTKRDWIIYDFTDKEKREKAIEKMLSKKGGNVR